MANEGKRRFVRAWQNQLDNKLDKPKLVPALCGAYFNGQKTIKVAGREDFIWARVRGKTSEVIQVFNDVLTGYWDLPILVYRDPAYPDIWKVYGRDISRYEDWGGVNYVPPHAGQHSFASSDSSGNVAGDVVWVFKRQFVPMLLRPIATATMAVYAEADFYYFDGSYSWFPGTGTASLAAYKPTGGHNAKFNTIYIDPGTNNLLVLAGPEFDAIWPPEDPGDYINVPSPDVGIPLGAVLLMTGTTQIGWGEIYDLRNIVSALPVTGAFTEDDIVWPYDNIGVYGLNDGVPLGTGTWIDWGDGLDATISGTVIHVENSYPGSGTIELLDEGVFLGPVTELNIVGAGVSATRAALDGTIYVHGQAWWDNGVPLCTGTIIDWGDNLDVTCSGSVIRVDAQAGGTSIPSVVGIGTGTYVRAGECDPLETITGGYWRISEGEFVTGSLAVAFNGVWQTPVLDFVEQWPTSGTFTIVGNLPTGTVVSAQWGAPYNLATPVPGIAIFDDQILTCSGVTQISFDDNLDVVCSGTIVYVTGAAGGGGGSGTIGGWLSYYDHDGTNSTYTANNTFENIRACSGTFVIEETSDIIFELEFRWRGASTNWEYHFVRLLIDDYGGGGYAEQSGRWGVQINSNTNTTSYHMSRALWGLEDQSPGTYAYVFQTYDGGSSMDRNIVYTKLYIYAPTGKTIWA